MNNNTTVYDKSELSINNNSNNSNTRNKSSLGMKSKKKMSNNTMPDMSDMSSGKKKKKMMSNNTMPIMTPDMSSGKKKKKIMSNNTMSKISGMSIMPNMSRMSRMSNMTPDMTSGKKKKKMMNSISGKKKKKMIMMNSATMKMFENDPMKKELMKVRYGNFQDINVNDNTLYWGLGIEHEMQLFHKSSAGMKNTNIMFDSQESTCFLVNDKDPEGACRKKINPPGNDFTAYSSQYGDFGLTPEEKTFLLKTQWELTGRQIKGCESDRESTTTIQRTPILMPELITTNFSNRTIDSISKELIALEEHYIAAQMKNPHTQQKVAQYGPLTTHMCGSHSEIAIPIRPTFLSKDYRFQRNLMTDYVGSYHVTITLPHSRDINVKDFVKMHQNMAQQIQWLEPLLMTSFFSPTQATVGNSKEEPEGSYRVMTIGWGNFGGSDIRKLGTMGLDRGSNIKSSWRKTLKYKGTDKLNYCAQVSKPQYTKRGSTSIHTGDFRTFGVEKDYDKCVKLYNPSDCGVNGRADGAPMKPPYGLEIRIFDHFPSEYLIELLRIIILIACNSQRHPSKDYVYKDKRWIHAVRTIMKDGWNATLDSKFLTAIRTNLGLPINTSSMIAYDIFKQLIHEMFEANKDAFFNKIMNEHPEIEPIVPEINRMCWEMSFTNKFNMKVINFLKTSFHSGQVVSINEFSKLLQESGTLEFANWENDINDLLYALETHNHVQLDIFEGKIKNVKVLQ